MYGFPDPNLLQAPSYFKNRHAVAVFCYSLGGPGPNQLNPHSYFMFVPTSSDRCVHVLDWAGRRPLKVYVASDDDQAAGILRERLDRSEGVAKVVEQQRLADSAYQWNEVYEDEASLQALLADIEGLRRAK
ncbi:unnamed protein product, partial [Prorocentrum cordatum]